MLVTGSVYLTQAFAHLFRLVHDAAPLPSLSLTYISCFAAHSLQPMHTARFWLSPPLCCSRLHTTFTPSHWTHLRCSPCFASASAL